MHYCQLFGPTDVFFKITKKHILKLSRHIIEQGSELVEIVVLNPKLTKQEKNTAIQAGVFTQKSNAEALKNQVEVILL